MTETSSMVKGRRRFRLLIVLCGAAVVWGGWASWTYWRDRSAIEEIESEIVAARYAIACRKLDKLLSRHADPSGKLGFLLGSCELARGRKQAAGLAWSRVASGSVFSARAIEGRMHLLQESGQLAAVEQLIFDAASDPRADRTDLLVLLVPIYREQGRIDEAERLIEERWEYLNKSGEGALEPAIKLVRQHVELSFKEGQPARAAELMRNQADINRARARYLELHDRTQPIRDAAELAYLALQLGRRFEARVFLTIALSEGPVREDLRQALQRLTATPATSSPR